MTETLTAEQVKQAEAKHVLQVYRRAPIVLVRGEGARVWDSDGKGYLDFTSGVGVAALGHANPGLAAVIADQARVLVHTSNLFFHPFQGQLAEKLCRLSGLDRAFFCNSGTEAVEACLKFARRYWFTRGETSRTQFVALSRAFHGRTFGSLSITADPHYREPFGPLLAGATFVGLRRSGSTRCRGHGRDRGNRPRADPGRRGRAAAIRGLRGGRQRSGSANGRPRDCG